MKVEIIGKGRLGRSLAALLENTQHQVVLQGRALQQVSSDLRLLAVPDAMIAIVAEQLPEGPPILHCSGCLDEEVLQPHRERGTFHPLMTFPGPEIHLPNLTNVSATISGTPRAIAAATELAKALRMSPVHLDGDRRLYHTAAVIAGNFSALMLCEAASVLAQTGLDYQQAKEMLVPLAEASIRNAKRSERSMTGPASRGDLDTLDAHRAALAAHDLNGVKAVYDILNDRILGRVKEKKSRS
jgi:predicted short-subunit dehydrogenase-like oxidoreductase (DUF2520 family)